MLDDTSLQSVWDRAQELYTDRDVGKEAQAS